jgi:hypothetical protein
MDSCGNFEFSGFWKQISEYPDVLGAFEKKIPKRFIGPSIYAIEQIVREKVVFRRDTIEIGGRKFVVTDERQHCGVITFIQASKPRHRC